MKIFFYLPGGGRLFRAAGDYEAVCVNKEMGTQGRKVYL
jgi:hypothetical protein